MPPSHGGKRPNSGRKSGEPTKVVRLPVSVIARINDQTTKTGTARVAFALPADQLSVLKRPLYLSRVAAGFPSPADDHVEKHLDLNEHLIKHKDATFFVRVQGDSMIGAGIFDNDMLVVDRALKADVGRIVIAAVNGELTVKRLMRKDDKVWLVAENPAYAPIEMKEGMEFVIWGVVTNAIHAF
jgi:DNA polymerase V